MNVLASLAAPLAAPPLDLLGADASLFLDFDGTLVEIAPTPEAVVIDDHLRMLLQRLYDKLDGRIALVSGRPADQIAALLDRPLLDIVGSHGMEYRWADGRRTAAARPEALDLAGERFRAITQQRPSILLEEKPLGVALHFRQAPEEEPACQALALELAETYGLHLQPGKMMVELRTPGGDKGAAIRTLMAEPAMAGTRPIFLGDDHTDEPGFTAAATLGGAGILIGPERPTGARYRLDDVADTLAWLEAVAGERA